MKTIKLIFLLSLLLPLAVSANTKVKAKHKPSETECLAKIVFAESENQSMEGIIAVAEAAINRSKRLNTPICKLKGVARQELLPSTGHYWIAVARDAFKDEYKRIAGNADSWNRGRHPASKGSITRVVGHHVFYHMAGNMINRGPSYHRAKTHKKHKPTNSQILIARK